MLKAGFGKWDITPRLGVDLYGFGSFLHRRATSVYDPLEARAVAFAAPDGKRFILISCDLCLMPVAVANHVRDIVCEKAPGLSREEVMVQCTHTHSGPSLEPQDFGWGAPDPAYLEILPWRIAQAGLEALANMEDVRMSTAVADCRHIGISRVYDSGNGEPMPEAVNNPEWEPAHPELTDTVCRVVRFDNAAGQLKGFLAYFSCHPVVCTADSHAIHGDFPGVAMHRLMAENPGAIGLFLQGGHGDINTACVHQREDVAMAALPIFAERFASAVRKGLAAATPLADEPRLRTACETIDITMRNDFSREHILKLKAEYESHLHSPFAGDKDTEATGEYGPRLDVVNLLGIREMLKKLDAWGKSPVIRAEIHAMRLGDLELLGAPFEIMHAIKEDTCAVATAPIPLVMSLVNGNYGYAPDDKQLRINSYESYQDAFMTGRMPFANVHQELLAAFRRLDAALAR